MSNDKIEIPRDLFTWEDVDALRAYAASLATGDPPHPRDIAYVWWLRDGERARVFRSISDRIASLLPPRP